MKSTFVIHGELPTKTVVYQNLYYYRGTFYIVNDCGGTENLDVHLSVHYRNQNYTTWKPKIVRTVSDIIAADTIHEYVGITHFLMTPSVVGHVGHTVFDDVFGQFNALTAIDEFELPIRTVMCLHQENSDFKTVKFDCKQIYKLTFGRQCILDINRYYGDRLICFKKFIVGLGDVGLSSYDETYISPHKNNVWKRFRDHLYYRVGVSHAPPIVPKILYVHSSRALSNSSEVINSLRTKYEVTEISWNDQYHMQDISNQIRLISTHNIYISTDGSAALNCIFLQDNSTFINMGIIWCNSIGWCEDYLYPALPYIRVLYYENYAKAGITDRSEITADPSVIHDMINMTDPVDNQSPNALLFLQSCHSLDQRKKLVEKWKKNPAFECNIYVKER